MGEPGPTGGAAAPLLEVRMLGRFEVRADGRSIDLGTPKQRAVLAILLLDPGRVVPSDRLLDLLWGGAEVSTSSLQSYVSNLRRVLEPDRRPRDPARVLVTEPPGYRVDIDRSMIDLSRFEDLVAQGTALVRDGHAESGRNLLDEALGIWHGPPLPELADEPYVLAISARLEGARVAALEMGAQARLDLGDHLGAIGLLEGPVAEHPLNERLHGLLALGLYRAGRQADALRVVDRVRRSLSDTAGLDPGPELRALEHALLAQTTDLDWKPSVTSAGHEPVATVVSSAGPVTTVRRGAALVGRDHELDTLLTAIEPLSGRTGGAAIVMGEAGIGKTRLVEELIDVAEARGIVTATARCPESGAIPPFWPVSTLASAVVATGAVAVDVSLLDGASEASPSGLFSLYESVSRTLASTDRPLLLVIDDLQWADADTLRLLSHLASSLVTLPVFVVATVRPLDDTSAPALVDCLAELTRAPATTHVTLGGLGLDAVADWLERRVDAEVPVSVARAVHERTGGNPLFVKELSELLTAEGRLDEAGLAGRAIPPGVQFVVRRRVARLPPPTQQILSVASVVGRSFALDIVAAVAGDPLDAALDAIAPALDSGLILDDGTGEFRFSHALVAEALEAELNATRRSRMHAATARALAERSGPTFGPLAALVAHHAMEGRLAGTGELAVRASTEAARRAAEKFGFEEAAAHCERVVVALESARPTDLASRLDALYQLSAARFNADLLRPAKDAAIATIELAADLGDTATMARAAALFGRPHLWPNQGYGETDLRAVAALERTVATLPEEAVVERARVLGALTMEHFYSRAESFDPVRAAAIEAARASGDPEVLARVLVNVSGPLRPTELAWREDLAREVLALSAEHDLAEEIEMVGWFHLAINSWDRADFDAALAHLDRCTALADRIGGGTIRAQLLWYRGATAAVRGDYDLAVRLGTEAGELYRRTRRIDAELIELTLRLAVAADRGGREVDEVLERLRALDGGGNFSWVAACANAWMLSEDGRYDLAAMVLGLVDPGRPIPDDYTALCGASMLIHVAVDLGELERLGPIVEFLEPYRGRWTQAGSGGCNGGLVDLALARAAAATGDADTARTLFEESVAVLERRRAPAWTARALLHQARFLLKTGNAGDAAIARSGLQRAEELASSHGLGSIMRQVERVTERS